MWPFKSQMKSLRFALCPSIRHKDIKLLCYECFYWFNQINRSSLTVGGQMSSRGIDPECFWQAVGASDRNLQMKLLWRRWSSWFPLPSGNLRPGSAAGVALVYSQDKSEEVGPSQPYPNPISRTSCYWRVKSHANRERDKLQIVRHKGNKEKSSS